MLAKNKTLLNKYGNNIAKAIANRNGKKAGDIICQMLDEVCACYEPEVANTMKAEMIIRMVNCLLPWKCRR